MREKRNGIEHITRYNKLEDIIRFNNFFTLDIEDSGEHLTKTGDLTRLLRDFFLFFTLAFSELQRCYL